jgi:hypothetical protein
VTGSLADVTVDDLLRIGRGDVLDLLGR